jgi:ATP-dependent Clp endopeptidase proteolytic subunit ClpP
VHGPGRLHGQHLALRGQKRPPVHLPQRRGNDPPAQHWGLFQARSVDIEIQARQIEKTKQMGAQLLADNCGQPLEKILRDFDRDYWMDAEESVAYGIVDAVLGKL